MIRALVALFTVLPAVADEALLGCRDITDVDERVACYDRVTDSRFPDRTAATRDRVPAQTAPATTRRAADGDPTEVMVEPADAAAHDASEGRHADDDASGEVFGKRERRTTLSAAAVGVQRSAHGKLIITLDNRQIWRQLDSATFLLEPGDAITIRPGSFGSYLLRKQAGGRFIRVRRID